MPLDVITGCMYSGKTKKLCRILEDWARAKKRVKTFLPVRDTRESRTLEAHLAKLEVEVPKPIRFRSPLEILEATSRNDQVVAVDEAQFIVSDKGVEDCLEVLEKLRKGRQVIVVGLDNDFLHRPFGVMPHVLAIADTVQKRFARCVKCGEKAFYTQRLVNGKPAPRNSPQILVGDTEHYEARCENCFEIG